MSEMVERVGVALQERTRTLALLQGREVGAITTVDKVFFHELARAAIGAMLTPTQSMITAGEAGIDSDCKFECNQTKSYTAMIDMALK